MEQIDTEDRPKANDDAGRVYLTIDEIKKMAETECEKEVIKRAFMFLAFVACVSQTSRKLKWEDRASNRY